MNHINSTTSSSTTGSSTAGPSTTSLDARRAKRSRRRTIGIGALATAAAVAGLVLSGISINGKDGVSGPAPAGAAELLKLSKIAASAELPGSGEILHSQTIWDQSGSGVEVDGTRTSRHRRQVRDIWVFPDRTWILRNDYGVVGTAVETERFGLTEPDSLFADMSEGLPNDFAALKAKLTRNAEGGGSSPNGELFVLATDALRESKASPELRASLFRVISEIPGIEPLGTIKDSQGRRGIGFRYVEKDGVYKDAIFDAKTSTMLADREGIEGSAPSSERAFVGFERVSEVPASVLAEVKAQALAKCGDPTGCVSDGTGTYPASTYKDTGH